MRVIRYRHHHQRSHSGQQALIDMEHRKPKSKVDNKQQVIPSISSQQYDGTLFIICSIRTAVMRQKLWGVLQDMEDKISASEETGTGGAETETARLDNHCRTNAEIDMKDLLLRLLFDVTSKIAFGVDLNTVSSESNSTKDEHPFFTAFDEMSCVIYNRFSDPLYPMKRRFGIGSEKHTAKLKCTIDDFAMGLIAERRIHIPASCIRVY